MADQHASVVELRGVHKSYAGREVVRGVDLCLAAGQSLALLGHNGAGKTTLIKLMLGLTRPDAGKVWIAGRQPGRGGFDSRCWGYLPENVAFDNAMTGLELLRFYARLKRVPLQECHDLLERVGLGEAARRRVQTYSKGMRQRLGLAQALLGTPGLLLLDEPTTGLDPHLRGEFYEIVRERQCAGTAILISTHALDEIQARTERIAIMNQGQLTACGSLRELQSAAGLPLHIRVATEPGQATALAGCLNGTVRLDRVDGDNVELSCDPTDKMAALRMIAGAGERVRDIELFPPGLEAVYRHFGGDGRAP